MRKKGLLFILCMIIILTAFSACDSSVSSEGIKDSSSGTSDEIPSSNLVMKIGAFNDPYVTEDSYRQMAESGINRIFVNKTRSHSQVLNILDYCDRFGMDALILAGINNKVLNNNDYMKHESFAGINLYDEPKINEIDRLAAQIPSVEAQYPGKIVYSNLFPYGVNTEKYGESYEYYVEQFCEKYIKQLTGEKILCFDIYPLERINGQDTIQSRYLLNLELIANYAKRYDAEPQVYLQAMGYAQRRQPTLTDMNFQAYCSFAFGYKSIIYFCYYTPGPNSEFTEDDYAIVDRDNVPTEIYDYVKSLNTEIYKFDDVYLSYTWQSTIPVYGEIDPDEQFCFASMDNQNETVGDITSVKAEYDALVGYFTKGGKKAYMVTNYMNPTKTGSNKIELTIKGAKEATVYFDGEPVKCALKNNVLSLDLPVGEGVFVVTD